MPRAKKMNTDTAAKAVKKSATKATTSTKVKKTVEKAVAPAMAEAPAMVDTTVEVVVTTPVEVSKEQELSSEFTNILSVIGTLSSQLSALKTHVRALEKKAVRELKAANKASKKRQKAKGNRQPSGFVKPTLISAELAKFLGKENGTEMARTDVTKEINSYIRKEKLQDKDNGRKINPDKALKTLLKVGDNDELTYFNLQRYMSPHFAKSTPKKTESV
tara:strand:- start:1281 stop:1934 length:654 start_codon:yes stop_codon:yes gene_type:complete